MVMKDGIFSYIRATVYADLCLVDRGWIFPYPFDEVYLSFRCQHVRLMKVD
jgi:hypothetical protein